MIGVSVAPLQSETDLFPLGHTEMPLMSNTIARLTMPVKFGSDSFPGAESVPFNRT